jgi:hypothetical protein
MLELVRSLCMFCAVLPAVELLDLFICFLLMRIYFMVCELNIHIHTYITIPLIFAYHPNSTFKGS